MVLLLRRQGCVMTFNQGHSQRLKPYLGHDFCLQAHSNVDNSCVQAYIGNENKTELQELEIKLHETEFDLERSNQNIERLKHNTVFASHNQSDLRYSTLSRGNQCTCISLSVILAMQEEFKISTLFLDQVLYEGDNLSVCLQKL